MLYCDGKVTPAFNTWILWFLFQVASEILDLITEGTVQSALFVNYIPG